MAKRSQLGFSSSVPAGIFHHLQCSAGRIGIRLKLLILFGEVVVTGPLLEELAGIVSPVLGWSEQDAAAEVERTIRLLEKVHGWCATWIERP